MTALHTTAQSIVISGGSRGLGLYLSNAFLEAGNRVASFARHETPAVEDLRQAHGQSYLFAALDGTDQEAVEAFVRQVSKTFGAVDALINNAAAGQDELLIHTPKEKVEQIIATNLSSPILLTRVVLKRMLLQPTKGAVVNVSSICGSRGYPGLTV